MGLMTASERAFARAVSRLNYLNPFLPERLEAEKEALGDAYSDPGPVWSRGNLDAPERPNLVELRTRIESLASRLRVALVNGAKATDEERELYEDLVLNLLYDRYRDDLRALVSRRPRKPERVARYGEYETDAARFLAVSGLRRPGPGELAHIFA